MTASSPASDGREAKKPRATRAEKAFRIHALVRMAIEGFGPQQLTDVCIRNWKLSPTQATRYVADAYEFCLSNYSVYEYKRIAALQYARFEYLLKLATAARDLQVMLQCNLAISNLYLKAEVMEAAAREEAAAKIQPVVDDKEGDFDPEEA